VDAAELLAQVRRGGGGAARDVADAAGVVADADLGLDGLAAQEGVDGGGDVGVDGDAVTSGGGGADIGPLMREGVPGLGFRTVGEHYFDWHHTDADTIDKIEKVDFQRAVAMLAVIIAIVTIVLNLSGPSKAAAALLSEADALGAEFVIWFFTVDFDNLWEGLLGRDPVARIWRDTGLWDETLAPRPALDTWQAWLGRARR
jgi:hypothetical protein